MDTIKDWFYKVTLWVSAHPETTVAIYLATVAALLVL